MTKPSREERETIAFGGIGFLSRTTLVALLSLLFCACDSPTDSHPWALAPDNLDWEQAFSKLSADEQSAIKSKPLFFEVSTTALGGELYGPRYGPPGGIPYSWERLDMKGICEGFNRSFGNPSAKRWTVIQATSFEQLGAPSGIQMTYLDLHWEFRDQEGKIMAVSEEGSGPGVDLWRLPPQQAVRAERNQAVALVFLKLVADLEHW